MAVLNGLICAFICLHVSVSCAQVLSTDIDPCTVLETLDPTNIYLRHKNNRSELSTVECSSLLISPLHAYDSYNYRRRKLTATHIIIPSCDSPTTLLLFMLKCGDVHPHPGPSLEQLDFSSLNGRGLHFLHLNIRSLPPKIDELRTLVRKTKAAVVGISESWLDNSITDNEIHIDGFCTLRKDRDRKGGGVCTFIRNDIAFRTRDDLAHDSLEATWFELLLPKSKPIVIGTVYRPPEQNNFVEHFEEALSKIRSDVEAIILGDFNICFKKASHSLFNRYLDTLKLFSFRQLIETFTRVTDKSATIIDHILCNTTSKISQSGVIPVGLK